MSLSNPKPLENNCSTKNGIPTEGDELITCAPKANITHDHPTGYNNNERSIKRIFKYFSTASLTVVHFVERLCGLWALNVARHPVAALLSSLAVAVILGSGLVRLNLVFRPYDLWVPQGSEFSQVTEWKVKNFPRVYREQVAIFEAGNVLAPDAIREMSVFRKKVEKLKTRSINKTIGWEDVCFRIPINTEGSETCYEASILEIWGYEQPLSFQNITKSQIIEKISDSTISEVFGSTTNFSLYLGGVTRNTEGHIIGARSALHTWLTQIDNEAIERGEFEVDVGSGENVDLDGLAWEKALVDLAEKWNGNEVKITLRVGHSLGYTLHSAMAKDALWIGVGWSALLIYVFFTLGRPFANVDRQRIMPSIVGLLAVALAVLSSYGFCSLVGIPYGTLNNVIPVLLVALGVDDMYVITTAWDAIPVQELIERRAQIAMERAGMAITVTSITNIVAFLVGTTTALPGLRWFCIYAACGIIMIYFLQTTFFVAAMVINENWIQKKKERKRKVFYEEEQRIEEELENKFDFSVKKWMGKWGICLQSKSIKGVVLAITFLMFIFSLFNATFLSREFDTIWLVPKSSTIYRWYHLIEETFPHVEEKGIVFFKGATFPDDLTALNKLSSDLSNLPDIFEVTTWFDELDFDDIFRQYPWLRNESPSKQCDLLLQYLGFDKRRFFSVVSDNSDDHFDKLNTIDGGEDIEGDSTADHPCSTFRIEFQYVPPETYEAKQASMENIRNLVKKSQINGYKAVWAHVYGHWETDRIIIEDLFKSLAVVLFVVALSSVVLLASVRAAFFVLLCVVGTLTNVASALYFLGLTVNTVTGIAFVLAVGICVDYAAHIAHGYLASTANTCLGRTQAALNHMGPAVFHGGASTFITFVLLGPSDSYIYVAYFKILSSVSIFGLFHALVFLPTMFSLFGPAKKKTYSYSRNCFALVLPSEDPPISTSTAIPKTSGLSGKRHSSMPNFAVLLSLDRKTDVVFNMNENSHAQKPYRHSLCWTNS